ncbi:alpha-ribazole phosphatase [Aquimarina sp. MAR_2010_214]|uniref:alpha-ribazole phosphatase n=1 Tax=Aquimarina sp. MAR_2010_214 TaxID=1250026 RepID=UPI000C71534D|nr:alpha-ribazole phosphatase [Aquimarina sp. MAR_2010_214]PKV51848.1 alpha-ribazole phosphatase [Aquimarina sp. MAR_2010_214]
MEIYLVRHTTPNIEKGICYGQSDIGITDTFTAEVEKIHQCIPIHEITTIYSSPLQRCKLLAKTFKKEIIYDNRLKELNFGDWELQPWDAIHSSEIDPWMNDFVNIQVPNGESYITLQERILDFYTSLNHISEEKIVIISHAGPMRALLANLQKIDLKDSFCIKIAYGEVIAI